MTNNPQNNTLDFPHLYKKGKLLKFKSLDDNKKPRFYLFSSRLPNLQKITNQTNNINQIVGRCWYKLAKLLSYFGIEKDCSNTLRKKASPWNKFFTDLNIYIPEESPSEITNSQKLDVLIQSLSTIEKQIQLLIIEHRLEELIKDFDEKITTIKDSIKQLVG